MIKKHGRYYWVDFWVAKHRVRRSLHTDEHRLALERARDIVADARDKARRKGLPFRTFSAQYLEWARQNKPASWRTEKYRVGIIQSWLDGQGIINLEELTPYHIEQLRLAIRAKDRRVKNEKKRRESSKATCNRYLALLRTMWNRAADWGLLTAPNPISKVRLYREGEKVRPLTEAEILKALEVADEMAQVKKATPMQRQLGDIMRLVLNTGLRRSEVLGLRWADVGDDALTVRGKGGKIRAVPLNSEARAILARRPKMSSYVFDIPNRSGFGVLRRTTETISRRLGVRFHLHLLRHAAASRMLAAGVDVVTISDILGHGSRMVTLLYSHSTPERMRAAVDTLSGHRQTDNLSQVVEE